MASDDERKHALERLKVRAEMRSAGDDERSDVIDQLASERVPKSSSTPPRAKILLAILNAKPSWQMVIIILAALAALFGGGMLRPVFDHLVGWTK